MFWSCFLHFYQPPTQKRYWVDRITSECYQRLIKGLLAEPQARLTLNINAVLLEFWDLYGHQGLIDGLRELLGRGQIELTGSAKYHPLLPKLPKDEIIRQIKLNDESCRHYLGDLWRPRGFFPPEMAYDRNVAEVAASLGYEWVIAEELSLESGAGEVDYSKIYEVAGVSVFGGKEEPLKIFFRERGFSYRILSGELGTPNLFLESLGQRVDQNKYLLTAMDGETFGHHRPGMDSLLMDLFKVEEVQTVQVSELLELFPERVAAKTQPATWALMSHDLERSIPFARWEDPDNEIHQMQWELTNLAIDVVRNSRFSIPDPEAAEDGLNPETQAWIKARHLLDRALHSDQYWWASARPWWSLEMIERGAKELLAAVKTTPGVPQDVADRAEALYYLILTTGFDWQREGRVEVMALAEDEAVRMRTDQTLPSLPVEEVNRMIATIRREMLAVAAGEEYERAVQLRNRIRELENYKAHR